MRGREKFQTYKHLLVSLASLYTLFPLKIRKTLLNLHRGGKGRISTAVRYALLKSLALECGDNVAIYEDVYWKHPEYLKIGDNVSIHPMTYIECGQNAKDGLEIGSDVSIAHGTTIMSETHCYEDINIPIKDQPIITKKIIIRDNIWIGAKVTILAGVQISCGCVIGANSVVTKSTSENKVYVGAPAKIIKER